MYVDVKKYKDMSSYKIFFIASIFISITIMSLSAQDSSQKDKHWVENLLLEEPLIFFHQDSETLSPIEYQQLKEFQQANIYIESNNFLKALEIYLSIYQENQQNFTALLGIANVYFLLGDFFNAKKYYDILYDAMSVLQYDARNIVRYRLAMLYFLEENEEAFVSTLQEVINETEEIQAINFDALKKILIEDGLDNIHIFVKVDFDSSFYAFRELGIYYISSHQYEKGINLLLYALSMSITHINNYLSSTYPTYEYTDMYRMIELVYSYEESLVDLSIMEFHRILLSLYKYINNFNEDSLMYEKWYVYSLIEFFDRNVDLLTENFLFVPFLL